MQGGTSMQCKTARGHWEYETAQWRTVQYLLRALSVRDRLHNVRRPGD